MNLKFWNNKTVLVTGHTGFKGSWLTLWLEHLGACVAGVSLPESEYTGSYRLLNIGSSVVHYNGRIEVPCQLSRIVADVKPDIVLHLAAQSLVRESYADPIGTIAVNVMGTANLLEAVRQSDSVRSLVCVTSDKCYENKEWLWGYRETDRLGGHDPYSNSKACAELVTQSFRDSFFNVESKEFTGIASARAGNVIGGGDVSKDRLLPDLIRGFNASDPVSIRNPGAVRPWQHVLEPLSGYLLLAEKLYDSPADWSSGWNFGPDESGMQTVKEIANFAKSRFGGDADWIDTGNNNEPHEAGLLKLDCSKARFELGWQPVWSVESAVNRTIDWDKVKSSGEDMRAYSLREIEDYVSAKQM